jgi:hypothetical protein
MREDMDADVDRVFLWGLVLCTAYAAAALFGVIG